MAKHNDILTIDERLKLLGSLRWWHLGYGFAWSIAFVGASTTATSSQLNTAYQLIQLLSCVLALVLTAFVFRRTASPSPKLSLPCGATLSIGSILFYLPTFFPLPHFTSDALQLLGGVTIGAASGFAYCLWQQFFVSEGEGTTGLFIPLSGFVSVALCGALAILPTACKAACAIAVLPALAAFSLYKSLSEIVPREVVSDSDSSQTTKDSMAPLAATIFCCCIIGFACEVGANALDASGAQSFWASLAGQGLSVIFASALIFLEGATLRPTNAYRVVYPLVVGAFCLVVVDPSSFASFSIGTLFFSSELMSMLLLYSVAVHCSSKELAPLPTYALCMAPFYASMLVGRAFCLVWPAVSESSTQTLLVFTLFLISVSILAIGANKPWRQCETGRASATREVMNQEEEQTNRTEEPATAIDYAHLFEEPLTPREVEVVDLITKGNTVAAVSRKLFISENTTRSHIKIIYRKAGVHSRQELIDAIDRKIAQ